MEVDPSAIDDAVGPAERVSRHRAVSARLSVLDDRAVMALLGEAVSAGVGIGGATAVLTVDAVPVFVKKVPLTDLERCAGHQRSTANLFGLPRFYQYGVGSAGFGAWRELAAHVTTTDWVLQGHFHGFPMLYHWRVLPRAPAPIDDGELERWVAHWEGSPAVRTRLVAIGQSSADVVLFMEYLPHTVDRWLTARTAEGDPEAARAWAMVDRELRAGTEFMRSRGLWHFDAHFHNLLTDGHRLYFADLGLAASTRFDIAATERAFLRRHANYDRCYTATHLARWLVSTSLSIPWSESYHYIKAGLASRRYNDLPPPAARIVARDAQVAVTMSEFFINLLTISKTSPYPGRALDRALRG